MRLVEIMFINSDKCFPCLSLSTIVNSVSVVCSKPTIQHLRQMEQHDTVQQYVVEHLNRT